MQRTTGSLWLFRAFGIDVHVHWLWFVVAMWQLSSRPDTYQAPYWKVIEYLSLFGVVLLHEFGHALACRSVGGTADDIVLWPLGGIAFVSPPPRPGALLWTIVAGPLVNVALVLPFAGLAMLVSKDAWPDLHHYFLAMTVMNVALVVFNMLPIYPLDGGQTLHALLWYQLGRWKSLEIVSLIGVVIGLVVFLLLTSLSALRVVPVGAVLMLCVICLFIALQSTTSFRVAQHFQHIQNLPRHTECACPTCLVAPPRGPFWTCDECQARFDTFDTRGKCPSCGAWFLQTTCPHCRETHHVDRWFAYRPGTGLAAPAQEPEEARP